MSFSDLYTNLISAYTFEENGGGIRYDKHGSNHLIVSNDVGRRLCHLGHGVDIVNDDTAPTLISISDTDQTGFDFGSSDFSVSLWFLEDNDWDQFSNRVLITKGNLTELSWSLQLGFDGSSGLEFLTSPNGIETDSLVIETMPAVGMVHHVLLTWNQTTREKKLYLNGSLAATAIVPTPLAIYNSSAPLCVGSIGCGQMQFDGIIDELFIWNRVITADEYAILWDDGKGRSLFPEVVDSADLDINFNSAEQLRGYRTILENTMRQIKYEPSRYEIDEQEIVVDNRGRFERLAAIIRFIDQQQYLLTGQNPIQGPNRDIY